MENVLEFITGVARQAGNLLFNYYQRSNARATLKADKSVVTEADLTADRFIAAQISARFPGEPILSEEIAPTLEHTDKQILWVIDPLDGTTNFSLGLPFWGVSIARLNGGYPETGVLYFPCLNELYLTSKGAGAYYNGKLLHVQPPDPTQPWSFFSCCSRTFRDYEVSIKYKPRILGSATYSLCCVARGTALLAFEATPKVWDFAAAWLLVQEAGGVVATLDRSQPFPPASFEDHSRIYYPILAAATSELLEKGRMQIRKRA